MGSGRGRVTPSSGTYLLEDFCLAPSLPRIKARWGRDRGLGGKGNTSRAGGDRKAARRAVPIKAC